MHYLFIDTCVWLTIAKSKNQHALLETLDFLITNDLALIIVPELVRIEFQRNKDRVIETTKQQVGAEFHKVKNIIESFGGENKDLALSVLNDVGSRLPILSEVTEHTAKTIESLMDRCINIKDSEYIRLNAVSRALEKKAPFHRSKNSVADSILIELFHDFSKSNEGTFHFITENHTDFSSTKDRRIPHPDFNEIFNENTHYHLDIKEALNHIDSDLLNDFEDELEWMKEDTRSLTEILSAIGELCDKIWFNRHKYREHLIESGEVTLIPAGDPRHGNEVIHENIWEQAKLSASKIKEKYDDTGPWDDFEWGMINGKLSALRWILGEEWDMLDT
ncbi:PIN domain-containing protein [Enterobacter kobei]|uniref:PIN domain-containing protein n=1 Tax=Enterobacter kobei TaxID=208224 RepID=UPI0022E662A3|nr:PIN domain-containing protein [Enterobacter kobei]